MGNPFYGRNSGSKYRMSVNEIRQAFILGTTARDRVRELRSDRVIRIGAGETPTNVESGPKLIFHALRLIRMRALGSVFGKRNGRQK